MCEIPEKIPILASPHPVFFPRTHVSLHLSRHFYDYLKKTSPTDGPLLGMVLQEAEAEGRDAVLPIGCVGQVIHVCLPPCGRAVHLGVHGLKKFRMVEGSLEGGYGDARIEVIKDRPRSLNPERKRVLLDTLKMIQADQQLAPEQLNQTDQDDESFLNLLCLHVNLSPMEKYFLLEAEDLDQRCGRLVDLLRLKAGGVLIPKLDHD